MYVCMYVCVYVYVCADVYMYTYVYIHVCTYTSHYPFIYWWTLDTLPCHSSHSSVTITHSFMEIGVHVSFQNSVCVFFRYIPRSGNPWSYGSYIFTFLRNLLSIFHSGSSNWHTFQQCTWVPFSPHLHQHVLFVDFLMIVILTSVK